MRLMSSQATFEPVSAKTQPVSGHTACQIPDIENSCSRDSSRKTPPSVGSAQFSSPKTRPLTANHRECRRFSHTWKSHRRDRTVWLSTQSSANPSPLIGATDFALFRCYTLLSVIFRTSPLPAEANRPARVWLIQSFPQSIPQSARARARVQVGGSLRRAPAFRHTSWRYG
jgi:hypothetical protein